MFWDVIFFGMPRIVFLNYRSRSTAIGANVFEISPAIPK
jgi:hypothetical protein